MKKFLPIIGLILLLLCAAVESQARGAAACAGASGAAGTWVETFAATLDTEFTDDADRNYRQSLVAGTLSQSGTKVRLTFAASSSKAFTIDGASIGPCSQPDYTSSPTRITFSGADTATVSAGTTLVSDEITFTFNEAANYCVHMYSLSRNCKYNTAATNTVYYNTPGSDDTMVSDITYSNTVGTMCISKIEVYQE